MQTPVCKVIILQRALPIRLSPVVSTCLCVCVCVCVCYPLIVLLAHTPIHLFAKSNAQKPCAADTNFCSLRIYKCAAGGAPEHALSLFHLNDDAEICKSCVFIDARTHTSARAFDRDETLALCPAVETQKCVCVY
jgi:hypothetical protein